jgi:hypothetical protein
MERYISTKWKEVQHSYFQWLGQRNTERSWAEQLTTNLLEILWDMWDHQNRVWHAPNNPCQRKARIALHDAVFSQVHARCGLVTMTLWHLFCLSYSDLLKKSSKVKKCWLKLIEAG